MLDVDRHTQKRQDSSLAEWIASAIGIPGMRLKTRVRGNSLHILCESQTCPEVGRVVPMLLKALKATNKASKLIEDPQEPIYQIILYGRASGGDSPAWIEVIDINQLDEHLKGWQISSMHDAVTSTKTTNDREKTSSTLLVSNETLARSGAPEAIARYISETLSPLGVSVKVLHQTFPGKHQTQKEHRLWVICNSNYSPDSSLIVETVAHKLRTLELKGFRDAIVRFSISGEPNPDWLLRIDLTSPAEMLTDWARWGDVEAIARLLNQNLEPQGMTVRVALKETTLHLFCSALTREKAASPEKDTAISAIAPILEALAPQGIQAATVYGVETDTRSPLVEQEAPSWIDWLNLPASVYPALSPTPHALAQQGDEEALTFLLQRLLNPDLARRLSTGGIRLSIRRKGELLHIMSEAPICPLQSQVGPPIVKFLRSLKIPGIAGIRVYGRCAGQSSPLWNYATDFVNRQKSVSEPTPEFAPSNTWSGRDLNTSVTEEAPRQDYPTEERYSLGKKFQQWLYNTRLFIPAVETAHPPTPENYTDSPALKQILIWGFAGILLTIQADWLMGYLLRPTSGESLPVSSKPEEKASILPMSLQKSEGDTVEGFNSSGFIRQSEAQDTDAQAKPEEETPKRSRTASRNRSSANAPTFINPSFNNTLLDKKLVLYQQLCATEGPPDILIVGSSRAMRGVDPLVLKDALAAKGYGNLRIFNFGINGATAQTVDLLIRQVLTPKQLPKLILWADGARAFNSGRQDQTYNAIALSEGYEQIDAGTWQNSSDAKPTSRRPKSDRSLTDSSQSVNDSLSEALGELSLTYSRREQLQAQLRQQYAQLIPATETSRNSGAAADDTTALESQIDLDGFLPLSIRFDPVSYYKNHAKVTGDYDADYESFRLEGEQSTATEALLQHAQTHKVPLVFVNVPLTQDYLDSKRTNYEAQFNQHLQQFANQNRLIYRDLTLLFPTKNEYFSDPSHLNRFGGEEVSKKLAQDKTIPWKNK